MNYENEIKNLCKKANAIITGNLIPILGTDNIFVFEIETDNISEFKEIILEHPIELAIIDCPDAENLYCITLEF